LSTYTEKLKKVHKKHQKAFTPRDVKSKVEEQETIEEPQTNKYWKPPRRFVPKGFYKK